MPAEVVYAGCASLVDQTLDAVEPVMRDPRRTNEGVDWNELAGIYVVGGASAFPPVYRLLREKFGAHRVRRSPHPFGSTAIGLAITLDERAGYTLAERLTRHFGVFREESAGAEVSFDILLPKDTRLPGPGEAPLTVTRHYRAAHNLGHFRFVECARIERGRGIAARRQRPARRGDGALRRGRRAGSAVARARGRLQQHRPDRQARRRVNVPFELRIVAAAGLLFFGTDVDPRAGRSSTTQTPRRSR